MNSSRPLLDSAGVSRPCKHQGHKSKTSPNHPPFFVSLQCSVYEEWALFISTPPLPPSFLAPEFLADIPSIFQLQQDSIGTIFPLPQGHRRHVYMAWSCSLLA